MLEGKIREATRFITEREESGGIMSPGDDAGKPKGRTVMEVLLSKHPEQANPDEEAFIECEELPEFLYVEVTSSHAQLQRAQVYVQLAPARKLARVFVF